MMRTALALLFIAAFTVGCAGHRLTSSTDAVVYGSESDDESARREGMPPMKEVWNRLEDGQRQQIRNFVEKMTRIDQ